MKIWHCKIGEVDDELVPNGGDAPMRAAIRHEYKALTGVWPTFIFSGWGAALEGTERAVVEDRAPTDDEYRNSYTGIRARLQQTEERIDHLEGLLWAVDATARCRGDEYGAPDAIDNDGEPYQSQDLHEALKQIDAKG